MPKARKKSRGGGKHRFVSKAQWRAMHARYGHTGWVKRWSRKNKRSGPGYKALPRKKRGR